MYQSIAREMVAMENLLGHVSAACENSPRRLAVLHGVAPSRERPLSHASVQTTGATIGVHQTTQTSFRRDVIETESDRTSGGSDLVRPVVMPTEEEDEYLSTRTSTFAGVPPEVKSSEELLSEREEVCQNDVIRYTDFFDLSVVPSATNAIKLVNVRCNRHASFGDSSCMTATNTKSTGRDAGRTSALSDECSLTSTEHMDHVTSSMSGTPRRWSNESLVKRTFECTSRDVKETAQSVIPNGAASSYGATPSVHALASVLPDVDGLENISGDTASGLGSNDTADGECKLGNSLGDNTAYTEATPECIVPGEMARDAGQTTPPSVESIATSVPPPLDMDARRSDYKPRPRPHAPELMAANLAVVAPHSPVAENNSPASAVLTTSLFPVTKSTSVPFMPSWIASHVIVRSSRAHAKTSPAHVVRRCNSATCGQLKNARPRKPFRTRTVAPRRQPENTAPTETTPTLARNHSNDTVRSSTSAVTPSGLECMLTRIQSERHFGGATCIPSLIVEATPGSNLRPRNSGTSSAPDITKGEIQMTSHEALNSGTSTRSCSKLPSLMSSSECSSGSSDVFRPSVVQSNILLTPREGAATTATKQRLDTTKSPPVFAMHADRRRVA